MNRFLLVAAAVLFLAHVGPQVRVAASADGETVFSSMRCGSCHKIDKKATAAALKEIAKAYGDSEKLVKYFNGESQPIIESDKPGMMKGQLGKLRPLSVEDKKALADYMMTFK